MDRVSEVVRVARARRMCTDGELARIRKEHKLSLQDVATALETGVTQIHRWEHGSRLPRPDMALRLMDLVDALRAKDEVA